MHGTNCNIVVEKIKVSFRGLSVESSDVGFKEGSTQLFLRLCFSKSKIPLSIVLNEKDSFGFLY